MNCDGKMSFGSFIFPINPYLLKITHRRTVAKAAVPYGYPAVSDMGGGVCEISGEGEFCGEDCVQQFAALRQYFENGGSHILYIPSEVPMLAVPVSLTLTGKDIENVIQYSFVFEGSEESGCLSQVKNLTRRTADGQKRLWDYANESGLSIETLKRLNPDVGRPDKPVPAGRSVYFC